MPPRLALESGHRSTGPARGGGHSTRAHRPRRGHPRLKDTGDHVNSSSIGRRKPRKVALRGAREEAEPQGTTCSRDRHRVPEPQPRLRAMRGQGPRAGRTTPLGYTLCHCPPLRTCSPVDKSVDVLEAFVGMIAPVWPEWRSKSLRQSPARDCPEHSGNSCTQFPCPPSTRLSGGPSRLAIKPY
uniref:Uncharacterized protein n=1 Tax=Pipistrellus kuhlii TaxID=59472 RepID=A0A7J7Y9C0_PIPKU|nr:hypothetical protein mPipKuh1_010256 [Pipistrellus kuhlii]